MFVADFARIAFSRTFPTEGMMIAARMAITAITVSSSTRVKALQYLGVQGRPCFMSSMYDEQVKGRKLHGYGIQWFMSIENDMYIA